MSRDKSLHFYSLPFLRSCTTSTYWAIRIRVLQGLQRRLTSHHREIGALQGCACKASPCKEQEEQLLLVEIRSFMHESKDGKSHESREGSPGCMVSMRADPYDGHSLHCG